MFRKKIINASSNLKKSLHLRTKIKSNGSLDIGTEGVTHISQVSTCGHFFFYKNLWTLQVFLKCIS